MTEDSDIRPALYPFGREIWLVEGPEIRAALGFHYPTRMVVARLPGGDLWIWSPVALTEALRGEVDMLGPVRYLVAPNDLHHVYLHEWAVAFPQAQVFAAPGVRAKQPQLSVHAELSDAPPEAWADEIDQVLLPGNRITTEIVFFHKPSGTVLFTDLLQQFPPGWFSGWRALVARLDLMVGPEPSVPRKFRVAFRDRAAARAAVSRIRSWPVQAVIMAHGRPVRKDAAGFLKRAFDWL